TSSWPSWVRQPTTGATRPQQRCSTGRSPRTGHRDECASNCGRSASVTSLTWEWLRCQAWLDEQRRHDVTAIKRDDVPVAIQTDDAEVRMSEVGEMTVAFFQLKKGADFGPALAGLPDDMCQCPHWGYVL